MMTRTDLELHRKAKELATKLVAEEIARNSTAVVLGQMTNEQANEAAKLLGVLQASVSFAASEVELMVLRNEREAARVQQEGEAAAIALRNELDGREAAADIVASDRAERPSERAMRLATAELSRRPK